MKNCLVLLFILALSFTNVPPSLAQFEANESESSDSDDSEDYEEVDKEAKESAPKNVGSHFESDRPAAKSTR